MSAPADAKRRFYSFLFESDLRKPSHNLDPSHGLTVNFMEAKLLVSVLMETGYQDDYKSIHYKVRGQEDKANIHAY